MKLDLRLLALLRDVRPPMAIAVGAGLLAGIVTVLQALYLSRVIDQVFLEGRTLEEVRPLLLALAGLIAGRASLTWAREYGAAIAAARIKQDLRRRLFAHLLALGPSYARGERTGELANSLVEGVEALDAYFSQYLPSLALAALVPTAILIFVFPIDLVSAVVFLVTAPLIPLFMVLIGKMADILTLRQWRSLSRMSAHFLDVLQGLTTLKMFDRSKAQIRVIARISDRFRDTTMGVLRVAFLSALVLEMLATVSTAVVAVEVGLRLLYGTVSFEQAFFVLVLAPEFYLPLRTLGASFHAGMSGAAAAERIFRILEEPGTGPIATSPVYESPISGTPGSVKPPHLLLAGVELTYDEGRRRALRDLSMEIGSGETVALVGPSGAGKSSIAHLLLRFQEPDAGQILVDGRKIRDLPLGEWRRRVAWVPQAPYLFNASIADNILLGRPEATMDEVVQASRQAHAHAFVEQFPRGYETIVGERGARLSGGQAQRIALARAFLMDAPLVILDEAASNLDVEHEGLIQESLNRLLDGRTALLIAHRLGTAARADRVVVLAEGAVAETGTHQELLARGGLYARLVEAAAGGRLDAEERPWIPGTAVSDIAPSPSSSPKANGPEPMATEEGPDPGSAEPGNWRVFLRLLRLAAPFAGWMALATLFGFATVGAGIGLMSTAALIIATAALHPSVADLAVPIVGVRFFGISRGVFRYLERYLSHQVTFRLLSRLRVWFYQSLEPLAPARLMQYRGGDLLSRIVADIDALEHFYVRVLAPPMVACLIGLLATAFLLAFDRSLAATLAAFLLLYGAGLPLLAHRLGEGPGREAHRIRARLNSVLVDGIQGMADLLAFGGRSAYEDQLRAVSNDWVARQSRMARVSALQSSAGVLLSNLGMVAVLVAAIPMVTAGRIDGVYLPVLGLAALASFEAFAPLPLAFQYLGSSLEAGRRLFQILDAAPAVQDVPSPPEPAAAHPHRRPSPGGGIVVRGLRFRYGPQEPEVLKGIDLRIPEGARVALVGPSGSGKSTLIQLLLRFWEYQAGQILLGNRELRQWPQEEVRRKVALVSQQTYLFNGSLRENLMLARPDASGDQLEAALRAARLHPLLDRLPQSLETPIGEQGLRLSGGERQRVAIARALLKDAPILVMDEPTANLDSLTEREVMAGIDLLMQGRTTLVATHRLSGLEAMDQILVMVGGAIVERGTHRQLIRRDGFYLRMWDLERQFLPREW